MPSDGLIMKKYILNNSPCLLNHICEGARGKQICNQHGREKGGGNLSIQKKITPCGWVTKLALKVIMMADHQGDPSAPFYREG